ncbi:hypothetical protein VZT92_001179 [Zoarces viviparus]|uniref:Uncharacterized protein n=1 Tax=Zoarces viviparus TaxID=48416 RepID=A0AAW1G2V1_ZOAVI
MISGLFSPPSDSSVLKTIFDCLRHDVTSERQSTRLAFPRFRIKNASKYREKTKFSSGARRGGSGVCCPGFRVRLSEGTSRILYST